MTRAAKDADVGGPGAIDTDGVVRAARAVLRRSGYQRLHVQEVADTAGVAVGTLYRSLGGKEALLGAILRSEQARATEALAAITADGTPTERVRAWVEAMVRLAFGQGRARAHWYGTLPEAAVQQAGVRDSEEFDTASPLRAAIADGVADGSFPHADPDWDAHLIALLCAQLTAADSSWRESEPEVAVPKVVEFVLGSLTRPQDG